MEKEIRYKLIEIARHRTTWSYSTLNDQLQLGFDFNLVLHRNKIGELLGDISRHESGDLASATRGETIWELGTNGCLY